MANQNTDSHWMKITGLDVIARSTFEYGLKGDEANEIRNAVLTTLHNMKENALLKKIEWRQSNYDELVKKYEDGESLKSTKRKLGNSPKASESLAKRTREARKKLEAAKDSLEKLKNIVDEELLEDASIWKELKWSDVRECLQGKPEANYR